MCDIIVTSLQYLSTSFDFFAEKANSPFGIATTGSFFGAVGGYVMVMYSNHRSEITSKIAHIKTAIVMSHSVFNIFYSLKKQHIHELCKRYEKGKEEFIAIRKETKTPTTFTILFDFQKPKFPYIDFNLISSKLFDKTDLSGRAFSLALALINTMAELKNLLEYRNYVIHEMNEMINQYNLGHEDRACLYYGVHLTHENLGDILYENYSNVMESIKIFNDSCIWFSKELIEELIISGKETANKLIISRPKVSSVEFSDIDSKLMPNDSDYKDWREKFVKLKS